MLGGSIKRLVIFPLACVVLIFVFGCVAHEASLQKSGAKLMTQSDLEKLFSEPLKIKYQTSSSSGTTKYQPDGTCVVKSAKFYDTGKYWIKDGQYCSEWDTIRSGVKCNKWYKISDDEYHQVDANGNLAAKCWPQKST